MKVFISWSGQKSKAVGDLLDQWLQCVIQAIDPWISTRYIDRGALWFTEITTQLNDTSIGIICLTKENINKPWILFEAGALAKGLNSSRVCTLLVDLEPSDIKDPLAQFNHTLPTKEGIFNLVITLNTYLGEKALKEKVLSQVFETYWPEFERQLKQILSENPNEEEEEMRSEDDILRELLSLTRNLDKRIRNLEYENKDKKDSSNYTVGKRSPKRINPRDFIRQSIVNNVPEPNIIDNLITRYEMSKSEANVLYLEEVFGVSEKTELENYR
jgi:hypothetical protein